MEFLIFTGGILLGVGVSKLKRNREKVHGVIEVDHETEQCKFIITSSELANRNTKTAVFVVTHDANISREEQGL